jgi:signal transduction histidine kinase
MVLTEYLQILPHYHITELIPTELYRSPLYLIGMVSVFGSTVILAAYFATYISNKLKERGERVAYYQERLNRELDLKSQYITTVSHGIEAPLSAIQSCLKVVLDGRTGPISEKSRDMIARAEGRCTFALHFVKDPLNLAKIRGAKRLTVSSVSLRNVLKEVLDQLDKRIKEKGIVLELKIANGDHTLLASQYAMEQVFSNLLANAIKYTPYGGEVVVEVKEEVNEYRIHVCDTGIGIPRRTSHIYFETSIGQRC